MAIIQGNAKQGSTRGFYPKIINGSLRFNDDDSARLQWTPSGTATDRKKVTLSVWVKLANILTTGTIINARSAAPWCVLAFSTGDGVGPSGSLQFAVTAGSSPGVYTSRVFRDPSAWYHVVVSVDTTQATASNRVKIWINGEQETLISGNYPTLNQEIQLNSNILHEIGNPSAYSNASDFYLANFYNIDGQALTPSDFGETKNGVWVAKEYAGTFGTNGFYLTFEDDTQVEAFNTVLYRGDGSGQSITGVGFEPDLIWIKNRTGTQWHSLFDPIRGAGERLFSNDANAEDFNGGSVQSWDSDGFTVGNNVTVNTSGGSFVAWCWDAGANNAVTGHSSVTWTGNGSSSGQVISGLPFKPDLIWYKTRNNSYDHKIFDSVRGASNRLSSNSTAAEVSFNELKDFLPNGFSFANGDASKGNGSGENMIGWAWDAGDSDPVSNTAGDTTATVKTNGDFSIMSYSGTGAATSIGHGLSSAPNFVIVKDRSAAQNWVVWTDDINTNGNQYLELNQTSAIQSSSVFWNSTAPDASKIYLGTSNSISGRNFICYAWRNVTGKQKFGSYTGTGSTGLTVTTGFRPGFLMIKRDGFSHWEIHDGSRDPFANPSTKLLNANQSNVEDDNANGSFEFTDTGFIVQTSHEERNFNGDTYIYAAFAGSYSDYITDYNTDGSIDSRVKASDTTGFSVVSYTGNNSNSTIGHGLSSAPDMIIAKSRSGAFGWGVYHSSVGYTKYLTLETTGAATTGAVWGTAAPTTSVFSISPGTLVNQSGGDYIAYCWTATAGRSAFGSYTANNSTNGPEVDCGFKPAFVMVKHTTKTEQWIIFDATRETTNDRSARLFPAISNAESSIPNDQGIRFLSTAEGDSISGFKITVAGGYGINDNDVGDQYIYAAFADTREAAFWLDQSSNNNDWQPVNLDHNDTVADSPTDNFATMNPLAKGPNNTLSDGNLQVLHGGTGGWQQCQSTFAFPNSGKWYCEFTIVYQGDAADRVGINVSKVGYGPINTSTNLTGANDANIWSYNGHTSSFYNNGVSSGSASTFGTGDVIQVSFDSDTGSLYFGKNGVWQNSGNPTAGTGYAYTGLSDVAVGTEGYSNAKVLANFGQQPFKYDPPA